MRHGDNAARNMLGERIAFDQIPWFWSDQYDANIQYAGHHTAYEDLVVRGRLDGSYAAFYMSGGVIDAVVAVNNAKDVRRAMPLIKARRWIDPDQLRDEQADLRPRHLHSDVHFELRFAGAAGRPATLVNHL